MGMARVIWANMQILGSVQDTTGVTFPEPARSILTVVGDVTALRSHVAPSHQNTPHPNLPDSRPASSHPLAAHRIRTCPCFICFM